ncbi:Phenylalanine/tyrosine ammonia-lyase [Madurella mycetomatis]|uniref:Phenylalanine/tyrosine ammonia-lyase n=1 Tax=Madurella mycetomatis TaxID=100816 RepID=A0A175VRI6_9PEZI|nr:Phenylalanine/tyrosine ammonia-lyase [Madurella mycetomatis]
MASPHACAAYSEWVGLQHQLQSQGPVLINGRDLTIADVVAVSLHDAKARLTDDQRDLQLVHDSVAFLGRELESSHVIYGVNTGFGGSADTRTQHFERLQSAAIQHLNVGILLQADKTDPPSEGSRHNRLLRSHALPVPIVKASMLIRCNSLMRGHSGVRVSVIESIMNLLRLDMTPVVPLRGSISASGDLSTLSYIAGAIEGNPDIFVNTSDRKVIPANEALKTAKMDPVRLQAKEGLGITNGTAPSCAAACLVIHQANQLALLTQLLTAMGTEALAGTAHNYDPFISSVRPHPGQTEAAANILRFLSGSKLCPYSPSASAPSNSTTSRVGLAQDRYALRTAPQWIGPQLEDLALATRQVATELNSTTDNPLIDAVGGRVHHGGNFQAMALTSAMEKTLTALQNLGRLLVAQSAEIINNATSKGLPPNLSPDDPSASFTAKGFDVNMAAYAAELAWLCRPVSAHVQVAEMANQSVNSMALVAARYAAEAVEVLALMAATYLWVLCQALDLRCLRVEFGFRLEVDMRGILIDWLSGLGKELRTDSGEPCARQLTESVLGKCDQLAHLDLRERCKAAVSESLGEVLELVSMYVAGDPSLEEIRVFQSRVASAVEECYANLRNDFFHQQTTPEYISPASRVVYDFVRKELNIPLNRGVEDHPPLLLRKAQALKAGGNGGAVKACNGLGANGIAERDEDLAIRGRILGTMASEIYEALRRGELHDRLMKFGEENGLWS